VGRSKGERSCVFPAVDEVAVSGERRPKPTADVRAGGIKDVTMRGEGRRFFLCLCEVVCGMGRRKVLQWGQGQVMLRGGARVSMVCLDKEDDGRRRRVLVLYARDHMMGVFCVDVG
jgi:hypothetical protein